jgi:hypothetical protein
MRELKATGWMHNRVRMIVASFLTKDLLIDWRWGEKYFMEKLLGESLRFIPFHNIWSDFFFSKIATYLRNYFLVFVWSKIHLDVF